jgi:hypothetical protein
MGKKGPSTATRDNFYGEIDEENLTLRRAQHMFIHDHEIYIFILEKGVEFPLRSF